MEISSICQVLYTDASVKDYAFEVGKKINAVVRIPVKVAQAKQTNIPTILQQAEQNGVRFGLVVNASLRLTRKIELVVLQPHSTPTQLEDLLLRDDYDIDDAIERIQQELNRSDDQLNAMKEEEHNPFMRKDVRYVQRDVNAAKNIRHCAIEMISKGERPQYLPAKKKE